MESLLMIVAIVQARVTSTRLPKKVFLRYNGASVLEHIYSRLSRSKYLDKVIFAIPSNKKNMILRNYLKKKEIPFLVGPELNVLKRFYKVCNILNPKIIIRVTADCPFVDYRILNELINFDQISNVFEVLKQHIFNQQKLGRRVLITSFTQGSLERMESVLSEHGLCDHFRLESWRNVSELNNKLFMMGVIGVEKGFVTDDLCVISEQDILGDRLSHTAKRKIKTI